jgi:hypothetical protein
VVSLHSRGLHRDSLVSEESDLKTLCELEFTAIAGGQLASINLETYKLRIGEPKGRELTGEGDLCSDKFASAEARLWACHGKRAPSRST